MEDSDKYYTPNITELYVGYICEIYKPHHPKLGAEGYWKEVKIGDIGQGTNIIPITKFRNLKKENRIRTKYLDQEDVASLGFVKKGARADGGTKLFQYKDSLIGLSGLHPNNHDINITQLDEELNFTSLFSGECKSINELNKILKLLKIK